MTALRRKIPTENAVLWAVLLAFGGALSGCGDVSSTVNGAGGSGSGSGGTSPAGGAGSVSGGSSGDASTGGAAGGSGGANAGGTQSGGSLNAGSGGALAGNAGTVGNAGAGGTTTKPDVTFCGDALNAAAIQFTGFRNAYTDPANVPRSAKAGTVAKVGIGDWTFGFVGGSYWYLYEFTQDQAFRTAAEKTTAALDPQKTVTTSHDLGFEFMSTYGNAYRLTQDAKYLGVIQTAAASLSTRFHATVGAIKSWDNVKWPYPVIIDNMMNLHLLFFANQHGGQASFADQATQHAETTLLNHFRPDASSYHLVSYDPSTGAVLAKQTVQGYADSSAWARGQSWGLYGYTQSYIATKKPEFLAQAQKIATFLMGHKNMPADKVPYWDYDAPDTPGAPTPRDASAAAVMASGLLQLAPLVAEPESTQYRDFALAILRSLSSPAYAAAAGANDHFILMHSTGNLPANGEIDVAINYADYYYLESLMLCRALGGAPLAPL